MNSERPLKILQLIYKPDHLLPLFNSYAKGLVNRGDHVTTVFLTGSKEDSIVSATVASRVEFCSFSTKQLKNNKFRVSRRIRQIWLGGQFDLAICHRHKPSFVFSLARLGLRHAPMLSIVHALNQYKRKGRQLHARFLYRSQRHITTIVAVSEAVAINIQRDFREKSPCFVVTIPNIIDLETVISNQLSRPQARKKLGVGVNDVVIGNVGRLVADKAQHDLLRAFAKMRHTNNQLAPNTKLIIIGGGKLEASLKSYTDSEGISDAVVFAGDMNHASRLMTAFDVFVLPSIIEPFGLVLLEAMAAKLPIVATRVGSIPTIVDKQALLVSPENPNELAQAISRVVQLDNRQRSEIGYAGYHHLLHRFNEVEFQQQLFNTIDRLVN